MNNIKKENIKKLNQICKNIKKENNINKIKINDIAKEINQIEEQEEQKKENINLDDMLNNI